MWKIPVYTTKAKGKGKNTKTLVFESKYPSENQAIEARFALISQSSMRYHH